jgi:hypothetical protein
VVLKLKFADVKKPSTIEKRQRTGREVIMAGLSEQIGLIEAMIRGEDFRISREVYKTGVKGKQTVEVTPRSWCWQTGGKFFAEVKYGNVAVDFSGKGLTAFEAGTDLKSVLATFQSLRDAIADGQADLEIEGAKTKARRKAA